MMDKIDPSKLTFHRDNYIDIIKNYYTEFKEYLVLNGVNYNMELKPYMGEELSDDQLGTNDQVVQYRIRNLNKDSVTQPGTGRGARQYLPLRVENSDNTNSYRIPISIRFQFEFFSKDYDINIELQQYFIEFSYVYQLFYSKTENNYDFVNISDMYGEKPQQITNDLIYKFTSHLVLSRSSYIQIDENIIRDIKITQQTE